MRAATNRKAKAIRLDHKPDVLSKFISDAAYAMTTERLVHWEAALQAIQSQEPLSYAQRCDLFLRAVNGDFLGHKDWSSLVGAPTGDPASPLPEGDRKTYRKVLERIIKNPKTAIEKFGTNSAAIGNNNVAAFTTKTVVDGQWEFADRVLARSRGDALLYALDLFLDPKKNFGANLRQCCREGCGRFGMAKRQTTPGFPPNFYCTPEHRDEHKRMQAIERARAQREHMTVDQYREAQQRKAK